MLKSTTPALQRTDQTPVQQQKILDSNALNPVAWLEETNCIGRLNCWLETLPQEHSEVLQHRFGLNGHELSSLDQTGAAIGITRERTRQVQAEALQMLRGIVSSNGLD